MSPTVQGSGDVTFVELEFDTGSKGGAQLGDIAASLVSLDELLRDLASIAAYPDGAEFRKVEIVAIELRSPLKIRLSLLAIAPEAVKAFQDICRDVILFGSHSGRGAPQPARIKNILERCVPEGSPDQVSEKEIQRISGHVGVLQNAKIRLKRVEVV